MRCKLQKKIKIILISVFFGNIFVFGKVFCVSIGSDNFVSRFYQQQVLNNGDRVAGFAALEAGFKLSSNSVLATFDSNFPVVGNVDLSGGTLSLSKDLIINEVSSFQSLGNIIGNNHKIELPESMSVVPLGNLAAVCGSESCSLSAISNSGVQAAAIYSCNWSYDDKFVAMGILNNGFRIYQFNGSSTPTLKYTNLTNNKTVNDLSWHPFKNLLAIGKVRDTGTAGTELQVYSVNQITGEATLVNGVETNVDIYAVDWHPAGDFIAVGQNNTAQEIAIYSVDSNGVISSTPISFYDSSYAVQIGAMRWNSDGTYLAVGLLSTAANQLLIFKFNKDTGALTLDTQLNVGYSVFSVAWSQVSPNFLAVGLNRTSGEMLQIYEFNSVASTLTKRAAKSDLSTYVFNLHWSPKSNCLAVGINYSAGYEFRSYYFDSSNYNFNQTSGFELGAYAARCVRWANSGDYVACGCDNKYLYFYGATSCNTSTISGVTFDNLNIFLNGDVSLKNSKINFTGSSVIDGRGSCLDLSNTSTIVIAGNSNLLFKNISIEGLFANNIYCTDSTSALFIDNCKWKMGSNYNFGAGHFELLGDFNIVGDGYSFIYSSTQQSIIGGDTAIILDKNVSFSYSPFLSFISSGTIKKVVYSSDIDYLFMQVNSGVKSIDSLKTSTGNLLALVNANTASIAAISITGNISTIDSLRTSTGNLLALVNANTANIDGNSSAIDSLKTSTGHLLALVNANIASIIANNSSIAANNLSIAGNSSAVDSLRTSTGNLLALVNANTVSIIANNLSIIGNSSAIDNLKTSTGNLLALVNANIAGNSSTIDSLRTSTGTLLALVNANTASIIANTASIASNNLSIAGNNSAIDSLRTSTGNLLALVNANIAGNSSTIDSLRTSTGTLLALVNANTASIIANNSSIAANNLSIAGNSSSIDNLKTSTGNLLALVNANIASIIANNSSIAANNSSIAANNLSIAGNSFAIDSLKTSTGHLLALVNSNTASIIANNSSIAGNSSAIDSLKTSTGELELYIDNIIDFGLEEIRDELDELGTITTALRVSIDDLYLRAGACVHNIYQDTNFTRDMLPKAGKVALFRFNECCLPTDKPRLIFDPSVYGESNEIELLDNARIIFEGEGIVELRDGVKFKLNGVAQELNNDLEFSSCAKIIVRNGAVLSVAANSIAQCVGVGQICVCGHGGSLVLDNENSQFIFGQSLNDLLKLLVEDCGLVSIDSQSSILTFQYGKFAVDFRRSSILNIYRGLVEFNSNKAVQATGKLVLLRFISGSSLMIDKCISGGQEIYAGTLRMCPNIGCETVKFDNRTGVIYGDGHLQFISFNKNLVTDLIVQHNSFKDINTMSKIFMQLGAVGQSSSSGSSGAANSISSPSAASPISFGVTTDGQIASFNSEVDSSAVKLKDGDHDISYVNSGNIFVVGIDKNGKVFKIDKDGNRTMIGKV